MTEQELLAIEKLVRKTIRREMRFQKQELLSKTDIAELLGYNPQSEIMKEIMRDKDFPAPYEGLPSQRPKWLRSKIMLFLERKELKALRAKYA